MEKSIKREHCDKNSQKYVSKTERRQERPDLIQKCSVNSVILSGSEEIINCVSVVKKLTQKLPQ